MDVDPGAGVPWPEAGYQSDMSDIVSDFVPGPGRPFPGCGDILKLPDFLSAFVTGCGRSSLGSGDMFVLPTFDSDLDPRPRKLFRGSETWFPRVLRARVYTH